MNKFRIVLTIVVLLVKMALTDLYFLMYSPLTGVATANQLNDGLTEYGWAKFLRDGGVPYALRWLTLFILLVIWINPIVQWCKNTAKNLDK